MGVRTGVTHDARSGDDDEVSSFDITLSPSMWAVRGPNIMMVVEPKTTPGGTGDYAEP
jgi:hypothetical protein